MVKRSIQCTGKKCKYNKNGKCQKKYINAFEIPKDMEVVNDDDIKIDAICHDYVESEDYGFDCIEDDICAIWFIISIMSIFLASLTYFLTS